MRISDWSSCVCSSDLKRSIAQIFCSDITVPGRFEPPVREYGLLAIGASKVIVTPAGFEQYSIRAREISAEVLSEANRSRYLPCAKSAATAFNEQCAREFFSRYGRELYRRPLNSKELASEL